MIHFLPYSDWVGIKLIIFSMVTKLILVTCVKINCNKLNIIEVKTNLSIRRLNFKRERLRCGPTNAL